MSNKCTITQAVTPTVLELIKQNPTDEIARTLVYSNIRQPLPAELKTFPEIQTWIEANITPKDNRRTFEPGTFDPPQPGRPPTRNEIAVMVTCMERVSGTCSFARTMAGSGEYGLTDRRLMELVNATIEGEEGWDNFVHRVARDIHSQATENPPSMEPVENSSRYSDYDDDGGDGVESDLSMSELRTQLNEWIRAHHPGLEEGLGI